jgi:peptidoglycan hydrolase-like protein with peptidoglycan-binding domain
MASIPASIRIYIHRVLLCVCIFMPFGAQADILTFDSILSKGENNGDKNNSGSWTTLSFKILNPVIGTRRYLNRSSISFAIDSDRNINRTRSDIRIGTDWLRNRKFKSANNKWNSVWVGTGSLNGVQVADLRTFDNDEKVVFAWIIANSDELINYSLSKHKNMPKRSRLTWERMARGQKFERNVRRFLGASARAELKQYDNFSHSKLILKNTIQPKLKLLNYYNGAIDGIGGPKTTKAIKAFEKANGLLVDGKLFGKERALLVSLANQKSTPKKIFANKTSEQANNDKDQNAEIAKLKKRIDRTSVRISALIKENNNLKSKINKAKQSNSSWDDDLKNTVRGQKNIILQMRKRISSLMKERNKLLADKSGGSNKYLITTLENQLNTLQIRYDVILKQRDKFRKAATQGGTNLSATADTQRNIIKTLRERISSLTKERNTLLSEQYIALEGQDKLKESETRITNLVSEIAQFKSSIKYLRNKFTELQKENNKLQVSLDSSVGNSSADKNQLSKLQNKYQKLYIENNDIKIDFDKLDRKYKQLASGLKAKNNKDTEKLQRLNEELSLSLQKQKILAYDAISQKSEFERKLKIAQTETMELNSQINDFSNIANANSTLKNDLSQARSQINSLNNKLNASKNSASAELAKTEARIAMLEEELEKSKNKFAELEKQKSSATNGQQRGFVLSSEWDELKQWITPQQIRFCTILSDYDLEKVSAQESGNQLKQNLAIDNRDSDIDALLLGRNSQEKGYFRNWIGTVEQVFAIYQENADGVEELAAGVVIKTPCNSVTVGSGRVKSADDERYEGTAFPSDPIYSQLSQVSKGDPILFEGSLLTYQDTGEANRSSKPRFFTNVDSSVNDAEAEKAKKRDEINAPDYFVKIDYLSKL